MDAFARIPQDPADCDLVPYENSCVGCRFYPMPVTGCPKIAPKRSDTLGLACFPDNRPDGADVKYVARKTYGNEEDA